jgi:hypothetical protein
MTHHHQHQIEQAMVHLQINLHAQRQPAGGAYNSRAASNANYLVQPWGMLDSCKHNGAVHPLSSCRARSRLRWVEVSSALLLSRHPCPVAAGDYYYAASFNYVVLAECATATAVAAAVSTSPTQGMENRSHTFHQW